MHKAKLLGVAFGIAALGSLNPVMADSESPDFSFSSKVLSLPNVLVDGSIWYSDVQLELDFDTGTFQLLGADAGDESSFEIRLSNLEDLVVDAVTTDEEADISTRLSALEQQITSPISVEGSTLRQRISALESVLSPVTITTNLQPGEYVDPDGWCFELTNPFVYDETRAAYFIRSCTENYTFVMELISGPLEGHPQMGDRFTELDMPDNRIYGLITDQVNFSGTPIHGWNEFEVFGIRQSGDLLILDLYSELGTFGAGDRELPYDTVTLTKSTD